MGNISEELEKIEKQQLQLKFDESFLIEKGLHSSNVEDVIKSNIALQNLSKKEKNARKTIILDPLENYHGSSGFREKHYQVSYEVLENLAKTPAIRAIIGTRVNQISSFSHPQYDKHSIGFKIKKNTLGISDSEANAKLSTEEKKEIEFLTKFLMRCGKNDNWNGYDFDSFLRVIAKDSFTYDQFNFEVRFDRKGQPYDFYVVDPKTIRLAQIYTQEEYEKRGIKNINGYYPKYVQIYQGTPYMDFYPWELSFGIRNPTSDIRQIGYGRSELEDMITIITGLLNSEEYNRRFFTNGASAKGFFTLDEQFSENSLEEFRQMWAATMSGVQNSHKTGAFAGKGLKWIDTTKSNQDMEFSKFLEYLIKLGCAIYGIDPAEINFPYSSGDSKPLYEGNNEARLKLSKDKGLRPVLTLIAAEINRHIVDFFYNGKYKFEFVGLDNTSQQEEVDLAIKRIGSFMTVNEERANNNMPPIEGGDVILNPVLVSYRQMEQQSELAAIQMAMDTQDNAAVPISGSNSSKSSDSKSNTTQKSLQDAINNPIKEYINPN